MKNPLIKNLFILLLVAISVIVWQNFRIGFWQDKSDRMESNFMAGQGNNVNVVNLTAKELKNLLKENNDSLMERVSDTLKMKVRPRNVKEINNYEYFYNDTNPVVLQLIKHDSIYPIKYSNGCWGMAGYFDTRESEMTITEKSFQDSIIDISGAKRAKILKWLFGGIRLGKFEQFNVTTSKCDGVITKKQINIIK